MSRRGRSALRVVKTVTPNADVPAVVHDAAETEPADAPLVVNERRTRKRSPAAKPARRKAQLPDAADDGSAVVNAAAEDAPSVVRDAAYVANDRRGRKRAPKSAKPKRNVSDDGEGVSAVVQEATAVVEDAAAVVESAAAVAHEAAGDSPNEAAGVVRDAAHVVNDAATVVKDAAAVVQGVAAGAGADGSSQSRHVQDAANVVQSAAAVVQEAAQVVQDTAAVVQAHEWAGAERRRMPRLKSLARHEALVHWKHIVWYVPILVVVFVVGALAIWSFIERQSLVIQPAPLPKVTRVTADPRSRLTAAR